jgi:hypothetical protein
MRDFLASIAMRSTPSPEVIQPRTPSLFEPRGPSAAMLAIATSPDRPPQDEHVTGTRRESIREALPDLQRKAAPELAVAQRISGDPEPQNGNPQPATSKSVDSIHHEAAALNQAPVSPPVPSLTPPSNSQPHRSRVMRIESVVEEPSNTLPAAKHPPREVELRHDRIAPPARENDTPGATRVESQIPTEYLARLVRSMIPSRMEPRSNAREADPYGRATSSEPAVQVTIGRIELRAATPPIAAGKQRAASPVMSLDEYLTRRRSRT